MTPPRITLRLLTIVMAIACLSAFVFAAGPSDETFRQAMETKVPDDPAAVVAVVGKMYIYASDLLPRVAQRIKEITDQSPQKPTEQDLQFMKARLFRSLLVQTIQLKMFRESFLLSQVGTQNAEKRADAEKKMKSKATELFAENELPKLYKKLGVNTLDDVDAELRKKGSSFESTKRDFIDQMLAYLYQSDKVPKDPPVDFVEIKNYYEDHIEDYNFKAKARWEQLTATFEKSGGRDKALANITEMGRTAYFGGSMQAVAKAQSQEPFASRGGLHEWTNQGSLASAVLEEQLFKLPTGEMSEIIEDADGVHIVRVLERQPAGVRPLSELQDEIRDLIKKKKTEDAYKRITKEISRRVPVWTLYPEDVDGALKLEI